jgi:glyoxylase-like metal-dependent hydrolase (beta-lactamase superfamily II)
MLMHPAEEDNYRFHGGTGEISPINDGSLIDLGKRQLEVINIPGHTAGSIALLADFR